MSRDNWKIREDWQSYVEENIDVKLPFKKRGFVKRDDLKNFTGWSRKHILTIYEDLESLNVDYTDMWGKETILDLGCGTGRFPIGYDMLHGNFYLNHYVGIDVIQPAILFLQDAFMSSDKHTFIHSHSVNARYNPDGTKGLPEIPELDYTLVVAWSVFTHLGHPANAEMYLKWLVSNVPHNCVFYITWFRSPPNMVNFGESRTVYNEDMIGSLYKKASLEILGAFGGDSTDNNNQWRIIAKK